MFEVWCGFWGGIWGFWDLICLVNLGGVGFGIWICLILGLGGVGFVLCVWVVGLFCFGEL